MPVSDPTVEDVVLAQSDIDRTSGRTAPIPENTMPVSDPTDEPVSTL